MNKGRERERVVVVVLLKEEGRNQGDDVTSQEKMILTSIGWKFHPHGERKLTSHYLFPGVRIKREISLSVLSI